MVCTRSDAALMKLLVHLEQRELTTERTNSNQHQRLSWLSKARELFDEFFHMECLEIEGRLTDLQLTRQVPAVGENRMSASEQSLGSPSVQVMLDDTQGMINAAIKRLQHPRRLSASHIRGGGNLAEPQAIQSSSEPDQRGSSNTETRTASSDSNDHTSLRAGEPAPERTGDGGTSSSHDGNSTLGSESDQGRANDDENGVIEQGRSPDAKNGPSPRPPPPSPSLSPSPSLGSEAQPRSMWEELLTTDALRQLRDALLPDKLSYPYADRDPSQLKYAFDACRGLKTRNKFLQRDCAKRIFDRHEDVCRRVEEIRIQVALGAHVDDPLAISAQSKRTSHQIAVEELTKDLWPGNLHVTPSSRREVQTAVRLGRIMTESGLMGAEWIWPSNRDLARIGKTHQQAICARIHDLQAGMLTPSLCTALKGISAAFRGAHQLRLQLASDQEITDATKDAERMISLFDVVGNPDL